MPPARDGLHLPASPSAFSAASMAPLDDHGCGALLLAREIELALVETVGAAELCAFVKTCVREASIRSHAAGTQLKPGDTAE